MLWDILTHLVSQHQANNAFVPILPNHVQSGPPPGKPLEAGAAYFRLWLTEMVLAYDRKWFQDWQPAVHSLIRFAFGGHTVEFPNVAGQLSLPGIAPGNLNNVIQLNFPLTSLIPFNGGTIEIEAGLLALKGNNLLPPVLKALSEVAGLLVLPQLSTALNVATPVANGLQAVFTGADGQLHLGCHQTYTGIDGVRPLTGGFFAVITSLPDRQLTAERLWVVDDRLREGTSIKSNQQLAGHSYMLFQVEIRDTRDDYASLRAIEEPRTKAIEALGVIDQERAESFMRAAVTTALTCPDLTRADRLRVAQVLKQEYDEIKANGFSAVSDEIRSLNQLVEQRAISVKQAQMLGEPTFDQIF